MVKSLVDWQFFLFWLDHSQTLQTDMNPIILVFKCFKLFVVAIFHPGQRQRGKTFLNVKRFQELFRFKLHPAATIRALLTQYFTHEWKCDYCSRWANTPYSEWHCHLTRNHTCTSFISLQFHFAFNLLASSPFEHPGTRGSDSRKCFTVDSI